MHDIMHHDMCPKFRGNNLLFKAFQGKRGEGM